MKEGLLGKKIGMTQIFSGDGSIIPATVIKAGPCYVVQIKSSDKDGYRAIQLGYEEKKKKVKKPVTGIFKKASLQPMRYLREIKIENVNDYQVGQKIDVNIFSAGELVDVTGISKGKGFQGGVKRWGWKGGPESHGSMFHREPGSIGASSDPSRVYKGHHLPGRMGGEQKTAQNLEIASILPEDNLLVVKGSIPGSNGELVIVRKSIKLKKTGRA